MVTIIYKPSSKSISSSQFLYIYDFGYIKGFLINDEFKLYRIINKELKDNIIYEFLISFTSLNSVAIELFEKLFILNSGSI